MDSQEPRGQDLLAINGDLKDARLRRRLSTAVIAERAFLNRKTLRKIEMGDAGVSMGAYVSILFVLGMTDRLANVADARFDRTGLTLEEERLPKRIRTTKKEKQRTLPIKWTNWFTFMSTWTKCPIFAGVCGRAQRARERNIRLR